MIDFRLALINSSWMFLIQIMNYLLPLIVLPAQISALGLAGMGELAFFSAILYFLNLLVNFGFNTFATDQISKNAQDSVVCNEIYFGVQVIRLIILLVVTIGLILIANILLTRESATLLISLAGLLIGNFLNPIWIYQGLQKLKFFAIATFIGRLFLAISILLLIRKEDDLILCAVLISASSLITGLISTLYIKIGLQLKFKTCGVEKIISLTLRSFPLLVSNIVTQGYSGLTPIMFGALYSVELLGMYSIAERLINAAINIRNGILQSLFPQFSKMTDHRKKRLTTSRTILIVTMIMCFMVLFIYRLDIYILSVFISDADSLQTTHIMLTLMLVKLFFSSLNVVLGHLYLATSGLNTSILTSTIIGLAWAAIICALAATSMLQNAYTFVFLIGCTEVIVFLSLLYFFLKTKEQPIG